MAVELELTSLAETQLQEMIMPYAQMYALRDTVKAILLNFANNHKTVDADIENCIEAFQLAVDYVDDNLSSLNKLHASFTEQLMEEPGNVERYSGE